MHGVTTCCRAHCFNLKRRVDRYSSSRRCYRFVASLIAIHIFVYIKFRITPRKKRRLQSIAVRCDARREPCLTRAKKIPSAVVMLLFQRRATSCRNANVFRQFCCRLHEHARTNFAGVAGILHNTVIPEFGRVSTRRATKIPNFSRGDGARNQPVLARSRDQSSRTRKIKAYVDRGESILGARKVSGKRQDFTRDFPSVPTPFCYVTREGLS